MSPLDTIQELKSRLSERLHIPISQQKLVLRGKTLHEGFLRDHQISDGCKLHIILSGSNTGLTSTKPSNSAFIHELQSLASKWTSNVQERDAFVTNFQTVKRKELIY